MRIFFKVLMAGFVLTLLTNCGNPIGLEKDLNRAESERKDSDARNHELADENEKLKTYLQHVMVSDNYIWILARAFKDYASAEKICNQLDYQLPDDAAKNELVAQIYTKKNWEKSFNAQSIHVLNKTRELERGHVFCMKPKTY